MSSLNANKSVSFGFLDVVHNFAGFTLLHGPLAFYFLIYAHNSFFSGHLTSLYVQKFHCALMAWLWTESPLEALRSIRALKFWLYASSLGSGKITEQSLYVESLLLRPQILKFVRMHEIVVMEY